jgi:hypothetical protein
VLAGTLVTAATVHAHATYNLSGNGPGIPGSTNGADGVPAVPPASWSNGPADAYAGGLPASWYCGMDTLTQVPTIQTGAAPNPPDGSLLPPTASTASLRRSGSLAVLYDVTCWSRLPDGGFGVGPRMLVSAVPKSFRCMSAQNP